jgi:hypothetical protein
MDRSFSGRYRSRLGPGNKGERSLHYGAPGPRHYCAAHSTRNRTDLAVAHDDAMASFSLLCSAPPLLGFGVGRARGVRSARGGDGGVAFGGCGLAVWPRPERPRPALLAAFPGRWPLEIAAGFIILYLGLGGYRRGRLSTHSPVAALLRAEWSGSLRYADSDCTRDAALFSMPRSVTRR